ncbi:F-box protein CPR1-like [Silene latifolia]|uniref:F-box protein CPR1-like n=1 Tax=Silene latifolia TaxID=37657 RepID=UPI003D781797
MLHYIVSPVDVQESNYPNYRIARLDLSLETWKDDLRFPVAVKCSTCVELRVLDRCLYLRLGEFYSYNNIWIMKEYGDEDSWSKTYNIPLNFQGSALVACSKDGPPRLLFDRRYFDNDAHNLVWYDQYADTIEAFKLKKSSRDTPLHLCIASLVRIPGSSINSRDELDDGFT